MRPIGLFAVLADGLLAAQSLVVAVGRAFAIPIGFMDEPTARVGLGHGEIRSNA